MNQEQCVQKIIEAFPLCRAYYDQHLQDYGELLLHVFVMETISAPLSSLLKRHKDARPYCALVESMWREGNDAVRNVVDVTILEDLSDDDEVWQQFGVYISQDFKDYINRELLVQNPMMWAAKRL